MRLGIVIANAVAIAFCVAVCALIVALIGRFAFMGALLTGLVTLVIAYNVEIEDGSAIGSSWTPDLYASQQPKRPLTPEESAARLAERRERLAVLAIVKHCGAALVTVGALGFYFLQL
ncbi:hypothetical protein [Microvirga pudoricolor]|uniref:hypothetical protein n=1 Tax=Microvirga pudoricolor TaxID=2778729 RepID=UPI00195112E7|nr:hypothetical protein [Microvirga pudoricolor]MBM6594304.1 hypothetical protein [Microvirga pudoricolor]